MAPYTIQLRQDQVDRIMAADTEGGGFQSMMEKLQNSISGTTLTIATEGLADDIIRYANDYGEGGWEDILRPIADEIEAQRSASRGD
jgi:hypothetical protein